MHGLFFRSCWVSVVLCIGSWDSVFVVFYSFFPSIRAQGRALFVRGVMMRLLGFCGRDHSIIILPATYHVLGTGMLCTFYSSFGPVH